MANKTLLLNNLEINQKINRLAAQIYEDNYLEKEILVVGLANKGYLFAQLLTKKLAEISPIKITLAKLVLNNDDLVNKDPIIDIPTTSFNDKTVILVDDVLNSGKTLIYGVKYLLNFPLQKMSTAVLVDRKNKKYPIGTHYVGLALSTTLQDHISVEFNEKEITAYLN